MKTSAIDRTWLALLAATAATWLLGESGLARGAAGALVALVFALSLAKGVGIALVFMELDAAPPLWRRFVLGWLAVVVAAVLAARWVAGA